MSSFIGRTEELARLAELFEEARLVTVLGPGGMGKARLALRYAETRLRAYSEGGSVFPTPETLELVPSEPSLHAVVGLHRLAVKVCAGSIEGEEAAHAADSLAGVTPCDDTRFAHRVRKWGTG